MDLTAFLAQNAQKIEKVKYCPSKRFVNGETAIDWEIGCITAFENSKIRKSCTKQIQTAKGQGSYFDTEEYQAKLTSKCVLFPNLDNIELQNSYGVHTKEELICTMLSPGEFEALSEKVLVLNGFKSEDELLVEAKN